IQPQQALTIEHAKIRDRPCPILFIIHTTNDGARPLHTKKGRAGIVRQMGLKNKNPLPKQGIEWWLRAASIR
ncbi:hypothetical protein, partial [Bifidobacterium animalis]|uniref:hypothetical protein n=1 Tax=Bifidobacterium animalis TaxID=28025 RepID=UPI001EE9080F